jgi:hypothetical protein
VFIAALKIAFDQIAAWMADSRLVGSPPAVSRSAICCANAVSPPNAE